MQAIEESFNVYDSCADLSKIGYAPCSVDPNNHIHLPTIPKYSNSAPESCSIIIWT